MSWRPLLLAIPLLLITSLPQIYLCYQRGRDWNGAFAYFDTDELTYAAYVNALRHGRPRRNDPYSGTDNLSYETFYSIQFVPAYAVALCARIAHISTATAFIALTPIVTISAFVSIFFLLFSLTSRPWLAAVGAFATLCFGGYLALPPWQTIAIPRLAFPFLRRYEPAVPFSLFFLMAHSVWTALTTRTWTRIITAGTCLVLLIYSYFFIWTAAAVWLFVLMTLWFWRGDKNRALQVFLPIAVMGAVALIPFAIMLSHRLPLSDEAQVLEFTRAPDLLRGPEVYGVLLLLLFTRTRLTPQRIFALSFVIATFVLFNQQIVSGRSLQPFHYEAFIANYWVAIAAFFLLSDFPVRKGLTVLICSGLILLGFLLSGIFTLGRFPFNNEVDRGFEAINLIDGPGLVFAPNRYVMTCVPVLKDNPAMWSHYAYTFEKTDPKQERNRLYRYLYYSGVSVDEFRYMLKDKSRLVELFGARAEPYVVRRVSPVTQNELNEAIAEYQQFSSGFTVADAADPSLSWSITSSGDNTENLDRWYERFLCRQTATGFEVCKLRLK